MTSVIKRQSGKLHQRVPNLALDKNDYLTGDDEILELFSIEQINKQPSQKLLQAFVEAENDELLSFENMEILKRASDVSN